MKGQRNNKILLELDSDDGSVRPILNITIWKVGPHFRTLALGYPIPEAPASIDHACYTSTLEVALDEAWDRINEFRRQAFPEEKPFPKRRLE